jgi:hypothetical protein
VVVVFICGVLVGIVATGAYHEYQRQQKWEQGLAGMKPRVMKHLTHELELSTDQQQLIQPILTRAELELLTLRMAQQPHVEATMTRTIESLKGHLTPDQQRKLDKLYSQLERRWESDRKYIVQLQP